MGTVGYRSELVAVDVFIHVVQPTVLEANKLRYSHTFSWK
jgi:hypothetical protein